MVRKRGVRPAPQDVGGLHIEPSDVDPIGTEQGPCRGKRPSPGTVKRLVGLEHAAFPMKRSGRLAPPIVEIAREDHRVVDAASTGDVLGEHRDLRVAAPLSQTQVDAEGVEATPVLHVDHRVKQSPLLEGVRGEIRVRGHRDRMLRQQRVAVMAFRRDRVARVGVVAPNAVREMFELRRIGPSVGSRMRFTASDDFLKKHEVRVRRPQRRSHRVELQGRPQGTHSLVDVPSEDAKKRRHVTNGDRAP